VRLMRTDIAHEISPRTGYGVSLVG